MPTIELLRMIAKDILLFGGALLVIVFFVLMIYVLHTIIKTNKLIDHFSTTFLHFREAMQKLLDPMLMFVNMLSKSIETQSGSKTKPKKKTTSTKKKNKKIPIKTQAKSKKPIHNTKNTAKAKYSKS